MARLHRSLQSHMALSLRPARLDEARPLTELALRSKAVWGYSADFMAACRDELSVDEDKLHAMRHVVAVVDGGIVGFYALEPTPDERIVELAALFVEPACIGTGVGRTLMNHALEASRALGADRLIIQGDPNAERFYIRAGATKVGKRPSGSIPGRVLPLFEIRLAPGEVRFAP